MSDDVQATYDRLCDYVRETVLLRSTSQLLGWDERTKMPAAEAEYRAEQITLLAGMIHRRNTNPELAEWLEDLSESDLASNPHSDSGTMIRELRRTCDKQSRLPESLVKELARTSVEGQQIWEKARAANDFAAFQPLLTRMVVLKQQQADAIGYEDCRYDALLDDFEPHAKTAEVRQVLGALRDDLVPLVRQISESGRAPRTDFLSRHFPAEQQAAFGRAAAEEVGFDFQRGRLDVTSHPFCSGTGPHDVRITTRYDEQFFPSAFFSILHEAGHGIYDQGRRPDFYGLPPGNYVSLGIHESQSRLWENQVARSHSFWSHKYAGAQRVFSGALSDVSIDEFYFAINDVRPSTIRVEADEATYNLHILIRFELEQALLDGDLKVEDLPTAWNNKYDEYLGITATDDADGVLQDIHWSGGLFGYFPTYSLGNLYAAQFFQRADVELGGLHEQFARGEFAPLREWLNHHIHEFGQCYSAAELVERITGEPLSHQYLLDHLREKLTPLYGLDG